MLFNDRHHAGELLAEKLAAYSGRQPLILAVPRGGVVVAKPVWDVIGGDFDLLIARKIGAPYQPELAIGATTGDGYIMLNNDLIARLNVSVDYIERSAKEAQAEIKRRLQLYRGVRPPVALDGRVVLLIDDGVATGFTLLSGLRSIRQKRPAELVLAVPVGPPDTLQMLKKEVDVLVCLEAPLHFTAVGEFYRNFNQVSDDEVSAVMQIVG